MICTEMLAFPCRFLRVEIALLLLLLLGIYSFHWGDFRPSRRLRKLSYYFCRSDSHSIDASYRCYFRRIARLQTSTWNLKLDFQGFFVLNSMYFSIRFASLHIRKKKSLLAFSVLVFGSLNNSFVLPFSEFWFQHW